MNKGKIALGVAAALIGSGLLWAAGSRGDSGIAGWETLNVSMEQAIGITEPADTSAAANGQEHQLKDNKQNAGQVVVQGEATGDVKVTAQTEQAAVQVQMPVDEQAVAGAGQNSTEGQAEAGSQSQVVVKPVATIEAVEVSAAAVQEGKINVNTAGAKELMDLPGIGEKKAQAIIEYRNRAGSFRSFSDLGKVKGIGAKMLEKLKPVVVF